MDDKGALKVLQSELLALKGQYGKALSLRKTKPGTTQVSPFPVTVTVTVSAPESAYAYDANCLELRLRLEEGILSFVNQIGAGRFPEKGSAKSLQISVVNQDLPQILCEKISLDLKGYWEKNVGAVKSGFLLDGVLLYARSHFVDLISSVPSCLEPYESVDETGASARRFAIVNPTNAGDELEDSGNSTSTSLDGGGQDGESESSPVQNSPNSPTSSPRLESSLAGPLAKEVAMIRLRFGESNFRISEEIGRKFDSSRVRFSVTIDPSDPDWEDGPLVFNGEASVLESGGLGVWVRLAPSTPLPWNVRIFVDGVLRKESAEVKGKSNAGRCLLKFVEGHIAEVVRKGEGFQGTGEEMGYINQDMDFDEEYASESDSSEGTQSDHEEVEEDEHLSDGEEDQTEGNFFGGDTGSVSLNSYSVDLEGLQLDDVDVMEGLQLAFQISCSRCKATSVATVSSPAVLQTKQSNSKSWDTFGSCTACHEDWSLSFKPKMIHDRSNSLGWVTPHACLAVDLLPSHFMVQCSCGAVTSLRGVQVGAGAGKGCNRCGKAMMVKYGGVSLVPKSEEKVAKKKTLKSTQDPKPSKNQHMAFQVPLKAGEPLPNKGTCQHYRHSHRWLRFPCCGMRFPCDLCHELGTDGHEMKWAVRMVCGYCSMEQALGEKCKGCDKKLAGTGANPSGRKTRFWEGGQGCRDKNRLDRRDAKKYKNSKKKTKSNKAKRVGPKAKSKTAPSAEGT
ncbi:hypothetical protein BSKO_12795 [Bryopsis sp. KO-2023]|nr:hypothetical protein BSKO_12795 [Bryopsis sp. KO-2023]